MLILGMASAAAIRVATHDHEFADRCARPYFGPLSTFTDSHFSRNPPVKPSDIILGRDLVCYNSGKLCAFSVSKKI
jgi:hypothetical protein